MPVRLDVRIDPAFYKELERRIENGTRAVGQHYTETVKQTHKDAARGGPGRNSRGELRSSPGSPPAIDSGRLYDAMVCNRVTWNVFSFDINDPDVKEYAALLEGGTRRMAARPLYRPALLQIAPEAVSVFQAGFWS